MAMHARTVFFISDGTGITAETFGNAILAQFEFKPRHVRLPFIDSVDKAHQVVRQVNHTAEMEGRRPIVFTTLVNEPATMTAIVVMLAPSACTANSVQHFTAWPFMRIVHAPHWLVSLPTCVPVRPTTSRM